MHFNFFFLLAYRANKRTVGKEGKRHVGGREGETEEGIFSEQALSTWAFQLTCSQWKLPMDKLKDGLLFPLCIPDGKGCATKQATPLVRWHRTTTHKATLSISDRPDSQHLPAHALLNSDEGMGAKWLGQLITSPRIGGFVSQGQGKEPACLKPRLKRRGWAVLT